jgi:hypothetical protein
MSKQIKLIWDFKGPNAEKTAEHHTVHLNDFLTTNAMDLKITGTEKLDDYQFLAFMVVEEADMKSVRDRLKPHRGQLYSS